MLVVSKIRINVNKKNETANLRFIEQVSSPAFNDFRFNAPLCKWCEINRLIVTEDKGQKKTIQKMVWIPGNILAFTVANEAIGEVCFL